MATYVLIHGAWHGGWTWGGVAKELRAAGHDVYAPSLDGCGDRRSQIRPGITAETQGQEIADLLFYEDLNDVYLVATSAGGPVMMAAATRARKRIGRLYFVDALAPLAGEKVEHIVHRGPNHVPYERTDSSTGPSREDVATRLFTEFPEDMRDWVLDRLTKHPISVMEDTAPPSDFWSQKWAGAVIRCREAVNPPEPHQKRTAGKLGMTYWEIGSGHYPMLTHPEELAAMLMA